MSSVQTIAVIGGGPAGSTFAERLLCGSRGPSAVGPPVRAEARAFRVVLFEEKKDWEKPCGGGLTWKALERYPFLGAAASPGNALNEMEIVVDEEEQLRFSLRKPITIYSRRDLNALLLDRAERAGAEVVQDRITGFEAADGHWRLECTRGALDADFVVIAAGARTLLRRQFAQDFSPNDLMLTFGYYIPQRENLLRIMCFRDFDGYAWSFSRASHLSVGICGKASECTMPQLKHMLHGFMERFGYSRKGAGVFAHILPSLSVASWQGLRLAGAGWALAGDAAGLVDPISGEGIYFAMRSGELLAESLLESIVMPNTGTSNSTPPSAGRYEERVRAEFADALLLGARASPHFYHAKFLGEATTVRLVQLARRSRAFMTLLQDMIEGRETYTGLVRRIYLELPRAALEIAASAIEDRIFGKRAA